MKKILIFLIMLLVPFAVSAKEVEVPDMNLKMNLDDNWDIFTRDNLDNNPTLEEYGISKDDIMSLFKQGNIYIDALANDNDFEFFAIILNVGQMNNLANYTDEIINKELVPELKKELQKNYSNISIKIKEVGTYKYLIVEFYDSTTQKQLYKYYTVVNALGYNFQIQKKGKITDEEKKMLDDIVSTTEIKVEPSKANETKKVQDEIDNYNKKEENVKKSKEGSKNRIIIYVIIGAVVGGLSALLGLLSKKKNA